MKNRKDTELRARVHKETKKEIKRIIHPSELTVSGFIDSVCQQVIEAEKERELLGNSITIDMPKKKINK